MELLVQSAQRRTVTLGSQQTARRPSRVEGFKFTEANVEVQAGAKRERASMQQETFVFNKL